MSKFIEISQTTGMVIKVDNAQRFVRLKRTFVLLTTCDHCINIISIAYLLSMTAAHGLVVAVDITTRILNTRSKIQNDEQLIIIFIVLKFN